MPRGKKKFALIWWVASGQKDVIPLSSIPKKNQAVDALATLTWKDFTTKKEQKQVAKVIAIDSNESDLHKIIINQAGTVHNLEEKIFSEEVLANQKEMTEAKKLTKNIKQSSRSKTEFQIGQDAPISFDSVLKPSAETRSTRTPKTSTITSADLPQDPITRPTSTDLQHHDSNSAPIIMQYPGPQSDSPSLHVISNASFSSKPDVHTEYNSPQARQPPPSSNSSPAYSHPPVFNTSLGFNPPSVYNPPQASHSSPAYSPHPVSDPSPAYNPPPPASNPSPTYSPHPASVPSTAYNPPPPASNPFPAYSPHPVSDPSPAYNPPPPASNPSPTYSPHPASVPSTAYNPPPPASNPFPAYSPHPVSDPSPVSNPSPAYNLLPASYSLSAYNPPPIIGPQHDKISEQPSKSRSQPGQEIAQQGFQTTYNADTNLDNTETIEPNSNSEAVSSDESYDGGTGFFSRIKFGEVTDRDIHFQEQLLEAMKKARENQEKRDVNSEKRFPVASHYFEKGVDKVEISPNCGFYLQKAKATYLELKTKASDNDWKILVRESLLEVYGPSIANYSATGIRGSRPGIDPQLFQGLYEWVNRTSPAYIQKKAFIDFINKLSSNKRKYRKSSKQPPKKRVKIQASQAGTKLKNPDDKTVPRSRGSLPNVNQDNLQSGIAQSATFESLVLSDENDSNQDDQKQSCGNDYTLTPI